MQYLKALVIGMGILIILGMGLLVYGFAAKSKGKDQTATAPQSDVIENFGDINLDLPNTCSTKNVIAEDRRLIIELGPDLKPECSKIIILDMVTGETLGTVSLYK